MQGWTFEENCGRSCVLMLANRTEVGSLMYQVINFSFDLYLVTIKFKCQKKKSNSLWRKL